MILEILNKVFHGKPSIRSILCNRIKKCQDLSPASLRSKYHNNIFKIFLAIV